MRPIAALAEDLAAAVKRALQWWLGELAELLPPVLQEALKPPRQTLLVELSPSGVTLAQQDDGALKTIAHYAEETLAAAALSGTRPAFAGTAPDARVIIRVPEDLMLVKQLELPAAARRDLKKILEHEIARQAPLAQTKLRYDYRITARDKKQRLLGVEAYILEKETIERCRVICRALGLSPWLIASQRSASEGRGFRLEHGLAWKSRMARLSVPALAGVAILLAVAALAGSYLKDLSFERHVKEEVALARAQALAANKIESEIKDASRAFSLLTRRKETDSSLAVLSSLADLLPDDAWVFSLDRSGTEVHLVGFASNAPGLIKIFDDSPLFTDAQFSAPLMQGPSGGPERFDLSMKIKSNTR